MGGVISDGRPLIEMLADIGTTLTRWLQANPGAVVISVGSALLGFFLLTAVLHGGGSDGASNSPPALLSVPYGLTQVPGHWIMIYDEPYRASIQAAVDEAARAANFAPPQVMLGGYVFADSQTRTTGFYCPPTGAFGGTSALPEPPSVLDGCLPVALSPELTGYTSRN